jgi:nitrogen fixation NifU-like protein
MKFTLNIKNGRIINARFWTDGCGATIACGSMLTKMIKGKNIKEITGITKEQLTNSLDGLPQEHMHCSTLAVNTLTKAIKNYYNELNRVLF